MESNIYIKTLIMSYSVIGSLGYGDYRFFSGWKKAHESIDN
jgi:hypothetical protein